MKLLDTARAMVAGGCSAAALLAVLEQDFARRAAETERKRQYRLGKVSHFVKSQDIPGNDKPEPRSRGQRIPAGAILTDDFRSAAVELGADPARVPEVWAEFVDYWVAVPGQRGVKLDWMATWRNSVRRTAQRGQTNGRRPQQQSLSDLAFDLAEKARSAERARGIG